MSEEQLKAFIEKAQGDTSLLEKLKAAADSDAVLAIANEAGFSISADDLKNAQFQKISDEELEGAAGGADCGFTLAPFISFCGAYFRNSGDCLQD